jgi:hypothetical protein
LGLPERKPNLQPRLFLRLTRSGVTDEEFVGADREGVVVHAEGSEPIIYPWSEFGLSFETEVVVGSNPAAPTISLLRPGWSRARLQSFATRDESSGPGAPAY